MTREEIWKDIDGYKGFYQVSNKGRVRSVDRTIKWRHNSFQYRKGRILAPTIDTAGYYVVGLHKESVGKIYIVHRLVAEAFIPNPDNFPIINHKDENKLNNVVENLEWCTYSYNTKYNDCMTKRIATRNKNNSYGCEKIVYQYDLKNNLIKVWKSLMDISRTLGYSYANIANCCKKNRPTAYGYKWSYTSISK